ncbi:MAG TPA: cytochrome c [Polyangia bacterium]
MKLERLRVALVFAAGAATGFAGCAKSNEAGPAVAVDPVSLYAQMCARCHGPDGRGDPEMKKVIPGIRDFSSPAFRSMGPEQMEAVIMTGKNQMPGFGAALSRPKIQHLAGYARKLGEIAAAGGTPPSAAPAAGGTPVGEAVPAGSGAPAGAAPAAGPSNGAAVPAGSGAPK